jgi:hypothetical protein
VDEGRTSLEIAQGEFIPAKVTSPIISPSGGDVSDLPDDASATSEAIAPTGASDEEEEEEEEEEAPKRRWCVVM